MKRVCGSLAGAWSGYFNYTQGPGSTTPFLARIDDPGDGHLSGETIEPDLFGAVGPRSASIVGVRDGASVDFTKSYVSPSLGYLNSIDYVGRVSEDGNKICGVWSLPNRDGTFEMHRKDAGVEALEEDADVELAEPLLNDAALGLVE